MQVFEFIDTNVLLHYRFFDEVDWAAEIGADEVTIVFAPVVFDELDKKKWSGTHKEKRRAEAVLKKIKALKLSGPAVNVRPKLHVMALDAEPPDQIFDRHRLQQQVADDRLLASLLSFRDANASARVTLLSADGGFGIKARARQVEVIEPDDALALADEPDEVEKELENTKRELARLQRALPKLRLTFAGSDTHIRAQVTLVRGFNYREIEQLQSAWRKEHPHIGGMPLELPDFRGGKISLQGLASVPGFVSEDDARARNKKIDEYFEQYSAYIREWPSLVNSLARILPFNIMLENDGTAPADDVHLEFWTDATGRWLRKIPKLPAPPSVPRPRGLLAGFEDFRVPYLNPAILDGLRDRDENEDGPNISGEGGDQVVQYTVKRVKHHVPCALPVVYFQFNSDDAIGSFAVKARIVAANITEPAERTLNVEVVRAAPADPPPPGALGREEEDEAEAED